MKKNYLSFLLGLLLTSSLLPTFAQNTPAVDFSYKRGRGFGLVTRDSLFSWNFQFRMQNRATYVSKSEDDLDPKEFEFRVRRLRLKFEGFVYDPRLTYYIQLSFSRGDMDWRVTDNSVINSSPNVVRDAVIYYTPVKNLRLGFGQTKLPGNRQRVISSGDQQFVDRSIVNSTFNIDRDFGFFIRKTSEHFILYGALTSGEGRNVFPESRSVSYKGLAYTGRIELLPFGRFTGNNDYQEGDLEREPRPKLSIGTSYSYNDQAVREAGQLGVDLYEPRTIRAFEADVLFKYKGLAFYNEYMTRDTDNPFTYAADPLEEPRNVFAGKGYLTQLSYLFSNNVEIAGRYTKIVPAGDVEHVEKETQQVEAGVTKYFVGHRLKVQGNILHQTRNDVSSGSYDGGHWSLLFQVEIGI